MPLAELEYKLTNGGGGECLVVLPTMNKTVAVYVDLLEPRTASIIINGHATSETNERN